MRRTKLAAIALALATAACATSRPVTLAPPERSTVRDPVILIPGITGTKLRDTATGEVAWGGSRRLFFPRDGGYGLAVPVVDPEGGPHLEAFAPILRMRLLGVYTRPIYAPVVRLMEDNGYTAGDLRDPRPGENFFFFLYDWRKGSPEAAAQLASQLERLRAVRGDDELTVTLVCQSNAALIGRYLVKYGSASLADAESGHTALPDDIRVDKLIFVGTANGGSLRTLGEMHHGRNYVPLVGRRWLQETLYTMPALYEGLPAHRDDLLVRADGATETVDVFDVVTWERFGWSIFRPEVRKRLDRPKRSLRFGDAARRREYVQEQLDHARALHGVLQRDPAGFAPPRYYSLQDVSRPSPERLFLDDEGRTWFPRTRRARKQDSIAPLVRTPGDGHATASSQEWLSPAERGAMARPTVHVPSDGHFEIILEREA